MLQHGLAAIADLLVNFYHNFIEIVHLQCLSDAGFTAYQVRYVAHHHQLKTDAADFSNRLIVNTLINYRIFLSVKCCI